MSSGSSYGASYAQDKGAYGQRSSSTASSYRSTSSTSSSVYAQSSRNYRYGKEPPAIHNGGGPIKDPNTSTSASNASYYP